LNKSQFSGVQAQFARAKDKLSQIRLQIQARPQIQSLYIEEQKCMDEYQMWQQSLESFLVQKTKEDWLNLGDTNDKYFFEKLKQHHHRNRISSI